MLPTNEQLENAKHTACFSGHRPEKLPDLGNDGSQTVRVIKSILYKEILDCIDDGYDTFITGLARGVDLWAGEMIMQIKAEGKPVKLVAVLPYKDHGKNFKGKDKFIFGNIMLKADETVCISEEYTRSCMRMRNEYMVKRSGKLIAVVSDYRSGTGQTIRCAQNRGTDVKIINAARLENEIKNCGSDRLAF